MIFIGVFGGLIFKAGLAILVKLTNLILLGLVGVVLTLVYDVLTNLAVAYAVGQFIPVMIAAVPFALLHIGSNALIFVVLAPVLSRLNRLQKRSDPCLESA